MDFFALFIWIILLISSRSNQPGGFYFCKPCTFNYYEIIFNNDLNQSTAAKSITCTGNETYAAAFERLGVDKTKIRGITRFELGMMNFVQCANFPSYVALVHTSYVAVTFYYLWISAKSSTDNTMTINALLNIGIANGASPTVTNVTDQKPASGTTFSVYY